MSFLLFGVSIQTVYWKKQTYYGKNKLYCIKNLNSSHNIILNCNMYCPYVARKVYSKTLTILEYKQLTPPFL